MFWNQKPWEFRQLSPEKKAELVATYLVNNEVDRYHHSESMKAMDKGKEDIGITKKPKGRFK